MNEVGSKLFPISTKPQRRTCICDHPECKSLSICFQSMDDVRGRFFSLPSSDGQRLSELKEFKLKRTLLHLGTQGEGSVDNRDQSHQHNRKKIHYVHYLWAWAHGMANFYLPLQEPANNTWFPKSAKSKKD